MRSKTALPYDAIFAYVYAVFRINLCLMAAGLPLLLAFAFTGSQVAAWPFFVALATLCGPAVTAAFAAFEHVSDEADRVGRVFWSAYWAGFVRSLAVSALAAAAVILLGVDLEVAAGTPARGVIPMLATLIAVVVVVTTALLAAGRRLCAAGVLACAYLCIRRWYLSVANLAVLGVLLAAIVGKPALGLAVLPGPALYVVWANTRHIVAPLTTTDTGLG
ncbi:hypothetical protein KDL01_26890 [Actinospica durhamensis]|uniref:Uncharacterized protein n=1 Tax=Actinospica durhamensis TaxID=1508375 RepID=A0A941ETH5_9ACTN|nr:hypothetical protein [Actinospica durhamensis]MBR7836933.1 hypothetical protein [Actinospica durhamensis]